MSFSRIVPSLGAIAAMGLIACDGAAPTTPHAADPSPAALVLDFTALDLQEGGATRVPYALRDSLGRTLPPRPLEWTSDAADVASVSAAGVVTAVTPGTATVRARLGSLSAEVEVAVRPDYGADLLFDAVDSYSGDARVQKLRLFGDLSFVPGDLLPSGSRDAVASPDGTRIAFTCEAGGRSAICLATADGTLVTTLTGGDDLEESQPTWSPDGERIAFARWTRPTPGGALSGDIWVMDADGSGQVNLTNDAPRQHAPAWSPPLEGGGTRIAFVQDSVTEDVTWSHLHSLRPDGSAKVAETEGGARLELTPTWSPNGRQLLHVRVGDGAYRDLWVVERGTRVERRFLAVELEGVQQHPRWSPNGRYVAFVSMHEVGDDGVRRPQVYTVSSTGVRVTRHTTSPYAKSSPSWAPHR